VEEVDEEIEIRNSVAQIAFNFCNDAVRCGLAVRQEPVLLAVGSVVLAMNEKGVESR